MRICIVGKYPPIQGGVSAQTYWAARGLAGRGHQVFVVTNAAEVEDAYRISLDGCAPGDYAPAFANGGSVTVYGPEPALGRRLAHIPMANPFASRLAGLATQVVREQDCELIIASYLEPYGVAGYLAAQWTGVPLAVRHAGSDLDRLMRIPELAVTYREVLRAATTVITPRGLAGRLTALGAAPAAVRPPPLLAVPTVVFHPDAVPLTPDRIAGLAASLPAYPVPAAAFDPGRPTIGVYGKVGETKGTYDLLAACGLLRAEGLDFNLLMLTGPGQAHRIGPLLGDLGLASSTWVLPFLPHWQVPQFIRTCTAVCFLERDFPIAIHGPTIPREVLATGTCLVLSEEIYRKQAYRDALEDGVNVVLVPDPKDRPALADRLRPLLDKPELAAGIGERGHLVTADLDDFERFVDDWEVLIGARPAPAELSNVDRIDQTLPWVRPVLGAAADEFATRFAVQPGWTDPEFAEAFLDLLEASTPDADPVLTDLVRYQRARLWAESGDTDSYAGAPPLTLRPGAATKAYPLRVVPVRVERFEYDVVPLFCTTDQVPEEVARQPERRSMLVCFARLPNLSPTEIRVSTATAALLGLCDGTRTVGELAAALAGPAWPDRRDDVVPAVTAALDRLRAAGLVSLRKGGEI
jgi:glycosyltransferase involved in cell wall biosynthesis